MKVIIGLFVLLFIVVLITITTMQGKSLNFLPKSSTVKINSHTIPVEVARTEPQQVLGLSSRKNLAADHGMLFVFPTAGFHTFWMKQMQFSLDMIFITNKKVVTVLTDIPFPAPNTPDIALPIYAPTSPADNVLEVPAGTAKKDNIKTGDTVTYSL